MKAITRIYVGIAALAAHALRHDQIRNQKTGKGLNRRKPAGIATPPHISGHLSAPARSPQYVPGLYKPHDRQFSVDALAEWRVNKLNGLGSRQLPLRRCCVSQPVWCHGNQVRLLVLNYAMPIHTPEIMPRMTPQAFAMFGNGKIGYVRSVRSEQVARFFPELEVAPGRELFTLHAADGTPLMVAATRPAAVASAREYLIDPVSVH